jgi:hypothetical protein
MRKKDIVKWKKMQKANGHNTEKDKIVNIKKIMHIIMMHPIMLRKTKKEKTSWGSIRHKLTNS